MDGVETKPAGRKSAREVLEDVRYYLLRCGYTTLSDLELLFPEYSSSQMLQALEKLTREGKATVEKRKSGPTWFWLSTKPK